MLRQETCLLTNFFVMTSNLIEDLKIEHAKIAKSLNEVISIGLGNEEGRKKLMDAKEMLMQHLEKEDKYLYPIFEEAAKEDRQIKHTLDSFLKDMEIIYSTLGYDFLGDKRTTEKELHNNISKKIQEIFLLFYMNF